MMMIMLSNPAKITKTLINQQHVKIICCISSRFSGSFYLRLFHQQVEREVSFF